MRNILIVIAVLALGGIAYYFLVMRPSATEAELKPPAIVEQPEAVKPVQPQAPAFDYQPEEVEPASPGEEQTPLPALADSDPEVVGSVTELIGQPAAEQHVVKENVVPRLVATIDALTSRQVSANLLPLEPPGGELEVTEDTDPADVKTTPEGYPVREYVLDPVNYQRYDAYVELLESVNTDDLLADYQKYRPLFQQAYVELGYPEGDFNARLVEVIDHLLDAPEASEPIKLIKPEAYYLFADPQLEALTAGQKLMIRMGNSNAQRVKRKLAEIRAALETVSRIN